MNKEIVTDGTMGRALFLMFLWEAKTCPACNRLFNEEGALCERCQPNDCYPPIPMPPLPPL